MSDASERSSPPTLQALLCVDRAAYDRFAGVLRHLCVGLVDQAVPLRIAGPDKRIESLRLGPIQALVHPPISGLTARRRMDRLLDSLSAQPPTIVHAVTFASYRVAANVAEEFEADLVFGVTSLRDCEAAAAWVGGADIRLQPWSEALAGILTRQFSIEPSRIDVIAPGVSAAAKPAAFSHPGHVPTIVSLAPFERESGLDEFLLAVEKLIPRTGEFQVFLMGEGGCERALRKIVRTKNLSSHVAFAPPQEDPTTVLGSADVLVRPLGSAEFAVETLQAMGAGLTVITGADDVSDHHIGGETAVVVAGGSAEGLADAILAVLEDRAAAMRIAAAGLELARRNHGVSAMAEKTAAAYRRMALAQTTFTLPRA